MAPLTFRETACKPEMRQGCIRARELQYFKPDGPNRYWVLSLVVADGPAVRTATMPLSRAPSVPYIWLFPMT